MIGAVHEIFTVVVRLCFNVYFIFFHANKIVSDEKCEEQLKENKIIKFSLKHWKKHKKTAK
jgi:hypothetical protein